MGTVDPRKRRSSSELPHFQLGIFNIVSVTIFFSFFFFLFPSKVSSLNYRDYRRVSSLRLERIQRHLDKINKPPVLTIEVCTHTNVSQLFMSTYVYTDV